MTPPLESAIQNFFAAGPFERFCRSLLVRKFSGLTAGLVELVDGTGAVRLGREGGLRARLTVRNPRFYARAAVGGSTGAGESYADGDWDCDDLPALVRIFVLNRRVLEDVDGGAGALLRPLDKLVHLFRRNTEAGARRNIRAHYDLGNDFFALFLDDTWMYSCGIFAREDSTLSEASTEKNDRICRKLALGPADHLLETGTGWGGFAVHAAKNYGCRVTTTTISRAQYDLARARVRAAGLEGRVEVLLEDYRRLRGQYDKLVSIEMIEAVGLDNLGEYFEACGRLLKPSGSMLLQSIIIDDRFYEKAKRSVDFIQRHIFPGSGIPSVGSLVAAAAGRTDMRLFHQEDLTPHYARTLRAWSDRLRANAGRMAALGYPERLYRMWQFYFAYCEGGFTERSIGLVQMLFTKPESRRAPILGDIPR